MPDTVIIGSGLAGWSVARELRKLDRNAAITLISADAGDFYSKPMLSNALAQGRSAAALVNTPAAQMAAQLGVTLHPRTRVTAIDPATARLETAAASFGFERLVLATGAAPLRLTPAGDAADAVLSVNDLDDYARFRAALAGRQTVAIIGAGLIGCEFANDLAAAGYRVHVIDPSPAPLAALLPAVAGSRLIAPLAELGVAWHFGRRCVRVDRQGSGLRLELDDATALPADLVLSAVGLRPATGLASAAGLDCGRGIRVDALLQSSWPGIHALGDCAEYPDGTLPFVMPIMHAARALAATLAGTPTPLRLPPLPVIVKTPAHPVVTVPPPRGLAGEWHESGDGDGLRLDFVDAGGMLRGFVLSGSRVGERNALLAALGR